MTSADLHARDLATLDALPLVAILRGLSPDDAAPIGEALVAAGIRVLEVPLSAPASPEALTRLVEAVGDAALVGAGTVLSPAQVDLVAERGGRLVVSPNADPAVIAHTRARGLVSLPGVATPTEAFAALAAGADALKLFPGEALPPPIVRAWRSVLPPPIRLYPTGGVDTNTLPAWRAAGASGFGVGTALYRPGDTPARVREKVSILLAAWGA